MAHHLARFKYLDSNWSWMNYIVTLVYFYSHLVTVLEFYASSMHSPIFLLQRIWTNLPLFMATGKLTLCQECSTRRVTIATLSILSSCMSCGNLFSMTTLRIRPPLMPSSAVPPTNPGTANAVKSSGSSGSWPSRRGHTSRTPTKVVGLSRLILDLLPVPLPVPVRLRRRGLASSLFLPILKAPGRICTTLLQIRKDSINGLNCDWLVTVSSLPITGESI